jgi:uncharacterized protein (DUF4415 family)
MTSRQQRSKTAKKRGMRSSKPKSTRPKKSGTALTMASGDEAPRKAPFETSIELYRPLKRPITLRLDADVLAWFKKDGRRYQTRINQALRKVVERERKAAR